MSPESNSHVRVWVPYRIGRDDSPIKSTVKGRQGRHPHCRQQRPHRRFVTSHRNRTRLL